MGNSVARYANPDTNPQADSPPTFDPLIGFANGRQPRKMIATEEEMQSALLDHAQRDYCAHKLLDYHGCRKENYPWFVPCHHQKHEYLTCQYEDQILRMKEYERERRLLERRKRQEG